MAGHSQFKNIMHRKGAQDAKRAKVFTKIVREITVSVKEGGADPENNPRLRAAIIAARQANMPKDNVERSIKKAQGGGEGDNFESVRYEGYGPGGVAVIVEGLTDNRNRTAADVRSIFNKSGGSLGETNSVSFMFDYVGCVRYAASVASADDMLEAAIECGAVDVVSTNEGHEVIAELAEFAGVRDRMRGRFGDPEFAQAIWKPKTTTVVNVETGKSLMKLLDALEDHDDVQVVTANYEMSDETMQALMRDA